MDITRYVADKIKQFRTKCNLTQEEVAEALGLTPQTVSRYENGERTPPLDTILIFAQHYGTSLDYIARFTDVKIPYKRSENDVRNIK